MRFSEALKDINTRFEYRADVGEYWQILKGEGTIYGDCEDRALTLVYLAEGRSMVRFWWSLICFKYVIWQCQSPRGVGHVVLWVRGIGWTDNIQRGIVPKWKDMRALGYRLWYPQVLPVIIIKFAFRSLLGKVSK